ncbi:hypothetical protein T261_05968 [Streptomyces lydicus]|nr:hypothetical protein T261_05968 [Streptomyces lydicus]
MGGGPGCDGGLRRHVFARLRSLGRLHDIARHGVTGKGRP